MPDPYTYVKDGNNDGRIIADSQELLDKLRVKLTEDGIDFTIEPATVPAGASIATLPAVVCRGNFNLAELSACTVDDFRLYEVWGHTSPGMIVTNMRLGQTYRVGPQDDQGFMQLKNLGDGPNDAMESMDRIDHNQWRKGGYL